MNIRSQHCALNPLFILLLAGISAITFPENSMGQTLVPSGFSVFKSGASVFIRVDMPVGRTCEGIRILRSEDGKEFASVAEIPGVCGSDSFSIRYVEEDSDPVFNREVQYQLEFGGLGSSEVLPVFLTQSPPSGHIVEYDVEEEDVVVRFSNPLSRKVQFQMLNASGVKVLENGAQGEQIRVSTRGLPKGGYFFRIYHSESVLVSGGKCLIY